MRKIGILLVTALLMACGQPDESLSGEFVLNSGGGILISMNDGVSTPAFSSQSEFWVGKESEKRVLSRYVLDGYRDDTLTIYHTAPTPDRLGTIDISSSGQNAFFTMIDEGDLTSNVIGTLAFYTNNHDAFLLNTADNYTLPNPANVFAIALDYNDGSELVYLGNYYDTGLGTVDQSVYIYELGVGLSATVSVTSNLSYDSDMKAQGAAAVWVDGRVDDTGIVEELAVGLLTEGDDGTKAIFKIFGRDGSQYYDSTGAFEFEDIGGLQWLGEESMILCVKEDGRWRIVKGDSSGRIVTLYSADSSVYAMEGLDLSPDGERCTTRVLFDESGDRDAVLVLSLN